MEKRNYKSLFAMVIIGILGVATGNGALTLYGVTEATKEVITPAGLDHESTQRD